MGQAPLRFRHVRRWPLPGRFSAITAPWGTCYHRLPLTDALRLHEDCHWQQYRRHGRVWFLVLYLLESARRGYTGNRFEVEARAAERGVLRKDD